MSKGEQLVLFTTCAGATAAALGAWGRANGVTVLTLPREIRVVPALPVLGTGKLDYVTMIKMAASTGSVCQVDEVDAANEGY